MPKKEFIQKPCVVYDSKKDVYHLHENAFAFDLPDCSFDLKIKNKHVSFCIETIQPKSTDTIQPK